MSSTSCAVEPRDVAVVVILYHPDDDSVAHIRQHADAGYRVFAVSNGTTDAQRRALSAIENVDLIDNGGNVGLARALNQGIERFFATDASAVLLLDQDSRVPTSMIESLKRFADGLRADGAVIGCVAPRLVDRKAPDASVGAAGVPATVATSGSLVTREALHAVGSMWTELFIDGIDHEWCFRARAGGFAVVVDPDTTLIHHMGDAGIRIGNRFRPIHRSPLRHYHIVRNTLWLQRCRHIPIRWRIRELVKLAYRAPVYLAVSDDRTATSRALIKALRDGMTTPRGVPSVTS